MSDLEPGLGAEVEAAEEAAMHVETEDEVAAEAAAEDTDAPEGEAAESLEGEA